jgi:hypothetical protein
MESPDEILRQSAARNGVSMVISDLDSNMARSAMVSIFYRTTLYSMSVFDGAKYSSVFLPTTWAQVFTRLGFEIMNPVPIESVAALSPKIIPTWRLQSLTYYDKRHSC